MNELLGSKVTKCEFELFGAQLVLVAVSTADTENLRKRSIESCISVVTKFEGDLPEVFRGPIGFRSYCNGNRVRTTGTERRGR